MVSEVFGPTVQGEGPQTGQVCGFLRLMACNLHCAWCDTPYTWDANRYDLKAEGTPVEVLDLIDQVIRMAVPTLVISGGEPLLHQRRPAWEQLLTALPNSGISVSVETNGTIMPTDVTLEGVSTIVASPKLAHAGDPRSERIRMDVLALLNRHEAHFKFVAQVPGDLDEIAQLVEPLDIDPARVWVMPEGTGAATQLDGLRVLAEHVIARRWNLSTRLHVLVWGNKRGV